MCIKCLVVLITLITLTVKAQIPTGYYDGATGKKGYELKTALHQIIKDHKDIGYNAVWQAFKTTDIKSNGKVWDMYSDIPNKIPPYEYTFSSNQCGEYKSEEDCYNREHSFPKS